MQKTDPATTVAAYCAKTRQVIRDKTSNKDTKFPDGVGDKKARKIIPVANFFK